MKNKILEILKEEKGYVSGERLSEIFDTSRTSIWKYINKLREDGYEITSATKLGYRLESAPDILSYGEVKGYLDTKYIGRNIIYLDEIDSTNNYGKLQANELEEGTVIVAERQTAGKGRLGRSWLSPKKKGIWMTIVLKPNLDPLLAQNITLLGGAAVGQAFQSMGVDYRIKWPNDLLLNGKKICGILTEMSCELNMIDYILMGIGINLNLDLEDLDGLLDKASSIKIEENREIDRQILFARILNEFELLYEDFIREGHINKSIEIIGEKLLLVGEEIRIIHGLKEEEGRLLGINREGHLLVEKESGLIEEVYSGEISIRGKKGYVS